MLVEKQQVGHHRPEVVNLDAVLLTESVDLDPS